ncbi:uncharacterized protein LOC130896236 [Diorhabda carinulata]|uniref:uncharacterized protein LOC130896236 n=1 Tax=Diorhabda carinulata TaxID=1163345 RepID=UPI0025A2557C|nr:uncharacterized protein LOC130896236 [Diorhabda carinulata]XP_057660168.1 uncharacterized protein LOC130896236 [Diorhabda carinulata]XP_057660169.1 uncharacterized protein LOC130896236 [Diorhabda carinulata]
MQRTETCNDFDAQKFVDNLLENGSKIGCNTSLCEKCDLPPFYDDQVFKKGQQFFYKHIFAMFFAKFNGLLAILAAPSVLKILMFTGKSSTDFTAYIRYVSTVFHMIIWYEEEFKPGSRVWKSLRQVNSKHNSASRQSCRSSFNKITQMDMALTQFGFMGFQVARPNLIGIHNATDEEFKAFIHFWKVVGYLMGIEDRFNICRDSVKESREICNILINQIFHPQIVKKDEKFLKMARHLIRGMWSMHPILSFKTMMNYLHFLVKPSHCSLTNNNDVNIDKNEYFQLNFANNIRLIIINYSIRVLLKYHIFRIIFNWLEHLCLWFMKVFPILAYYSFGTKNSLVKINV